MGTSDDDTLMLLKTKYLIKSKLQLVLLVLVAHTGVVGAATAADKVSFNRQIQPILSEYCYHCHGPDSATRKPKKHPLRLDRVQDAFEFRDDGKPVILKGNPADSEVIKRITSRDEDVVMPPTSEHKTMKPSEIALLGQWIGQGAVFETHWSFMAPLRPTPAADPTGWAKNPIDQFVASQLRVHGLKPNSEEQKSRLFRRLSFDLTGLPPSPKELSEFLKDNRPDAYERAVDRMLSSDASSEQFARHWLDAVRYADTQGIHHDHMRSVWPYRDWVIGAFKANLPFDQFTIQQLAGDLLPEATMDQKVASGFNRILPTTGEGGAIPEEYAAIYAKDRVDTTTAVWLGLTAGCATCHDHKFDPTTTKDFYSLTAFFRNNTVSTLDSGRDANTAPLLFVPRREDRQRGPEVEAALTGKKTEIEERKRKTAPDFARWLASAERRPLREPSTPKPVLLLPLDDTNAVAVGTAAGRRIEWPAGKERRSGLFGPASLLVSGDAVKGRAPELTPQSRSSYGAFIYVEDKPSGAVFSRMNKAEGFRGWDLFLTDGKPTVHIIDQYPDAALKVTAKTALKPGRWHHVLAVFDGRNKGAEAIGLYVDGRKASVDVNNNSLGTNIVTKAPLRLGGRSDGTEIVEKIKGGKVFLQDVRIYDQALTQADIARLAVPGLLRDYSAERTSEKKDLLFELFMTGFDTRGIRLQGELAKLQTEQDGIRARGANTLIMGEKTNGTATANILVRGSYSNKGAQVNAATPEFLPPMPPDAPRNRLGLAQWMVSTNNPLSARVTVNRVWSQLFGLGIVETTEDFGLMGSRPSNQDLLDWLAVDFMDSGWNYRRLVRTIVTSASYRQSGAITPEKIEKDPLNKLISRGPRYRLDAEQIRDQALAASGLLVRRVGGPSVRPYQPEGVWEAVAMKDSNTRVYKQDEGEGLYRRSLYTFWKRTAPPPSMEILNSPSREVFCTRRERTDTPLQAFITMNDPQFVEAARQLATVAMKSSGNFDARLDRITDSLLARRLSESDRAVVRRMEQRALQQYQKDSAAARSLITVGESIPAPKLPAAELAAWTMVASQIMNLDESLTK